MKFEAPLVAPSIIGLPSDSSPSAVDDFIENVRTLFSKQNDAEKLAIRINAIDEDATAFRGLVEAMAAKIAPELGELPADDVVMRLNTRLSENRSKQTKRQQLEEQQACLRPRDRFWDIPVPKIDSAFDNLLVPQPSWSPSTTQQFRKLVAAPYLSPNDWTPRSEAYFVFPLAQGTPGKQCSLAATGDYQPSLRSPWLAAVVV